MDSWNAIGKHWLQKYDKQFGVDFFLCKCSDIKGLDIAIWFGLLSQRNFQIKSFTSFLYFSGIPLISVSKQKIFND
jgi:hypothetical protein